MPLLALSDGSYVVAAGPDVVLEQPVSFEVDANGVPVMTITGFAPVRWLHRRLRVANVGSERRIEGRVEAPGAQSRRPRQVDVVHQELLSAVGDMGQTLPFGIEQAGC